MENALGVVVVERADEVAQLHPLVLEFHDGGGQKQFDGLHVDMFGLMFKGASGGTGAERTPPRLYFGSGRCVRDYSCRRSSGYLLSGGSIMAVTLSSVRSQSARHSRSSGRCSP